MCRNDMTNKFVDKPYDCRFLEKETTFIKHLHQQYFMFVYMESV
jgi:hypothetical protein